MRQLLRKIFPAALILCGPTLVVTIQVYLMNKTYEVPVISSTVRPTLQEVTWERVYQQSDIKALLKTAISLQPRSVQKQWTKSSIEEVVYVTDKLGYSSLGIDHYTALAIIYHESGFKIDQVTPNVDTDGTVLSNDYYLTQQNSEVVSQRYYSLKSYLAKKESDPALKTLLLQKMRGEFSVGKIKDPAVNVALMFQTFRECKQILGKGSKNLHRMVLCYNSPAYAKRIRQNLIKKSSYVQAVLARRKQLIDLL